jgi:hypothetical protein
MRIWIACIAIATTLAGCVSAAQLAAGDDSKCKSYGFTLGSPGYAQCRMSLDVQRQQAAREVGAAIADGLDQANESYARAASTPAYSPPQPSTVPPPCAEGYRCTERTLQADGVWR